MSKLATLFTLALLLSLSITSASRPNFVFKGVSSLHEVRFSFLIEQLVKAYTRLFLFLF